MLLLSHSVTFNSLQPHRLHHAKLPCTSPSPGVCANSCPLSRWCYLTISSSVTCFSFCLQSFTASEFFPTSQLFASGAQSIGTSALSSVLPMNIQGWFPLGLAVQGTLKNPSVPQFERINFLVLSLLYAPTIISIHDYWKKHSFDYTDLCWQSNVSAFDCYLGWS